MVQRQVLNCLVEGGQMPYTWGKFRIESRTHNHYCRTGRVGQLLIGALFSTVYSFGLYTCTVHIKHVEFSNF